MDYIMDHDDISRQFREEHERIRRILDGPLGDFLRQDRTSELLNSAAASVSAMDFKDLGTATARIAESLTFGEKLSEAVRQQLTLQDPKLLSVLSQIEHQYPKPLFLDAQEAIKNLTSSEGLNHAVKFLEVHPRELDALVGGLRVS